MRKIILLLLALLLCMTLIACDEFSSTPPNNTDNSVNPSEDETPNGDLSNKDDSNENKDDENEKEDPDKSDDLENETDPEPPSGDTTDPDEPSKLQYGQDFRAAQSPTDMIFTCMGPTDRTISGVLSISSSYGEYPVISVWAGAFEGCKNLTAVTIEEGVTAIYLRAFADCTALTEISLPSTLTQISYEAFVGCDNLVDIYFNGLRMQWDRIMLENEFILPSSQGCVVHCANGDVVISPDT